MKIHNLGLPRIGKRRELKKALEKYWKGVLSLNDLYEIGLSIKEENWGVQEKFGVDFIPVGDFSYYDHILDTSFLFNNIPERFKSLNISSMDKYFAVARGYTDKTENVTASDMRKWFNTNYHYIVPEFTSKTTFKLNPEKIINEIDEALSYGLSVDKIKPVITGPLTYLWSGKENGISRLELLPDLVAEYKKLITLIKEKGIKWIQLDEPILVLDKLDSNWAEGFRAAYNDLVSGINIIVATYFEEVSDNLDIVYNLPVKGFHFDLTKDYSEKLSDYKEITKGLNKDQIISLGVVSGRNIWVTDLSQVAETLKNIQGELGDRLWIGPSCSLLHLPVTSSQEDRLSAEQSRWLKFAYERLHELSTLKNCFRQNIDKELEENRKVIQSLEAVRERSKNLNKRLEEIEGVAITRKSSYEERAEIQNNFLKLPLLPTTTIGSFPQTEEIRKTRLLWNRGQIDNSKYEKVIRDEIKTVINKQEDLNLDVLVHGEPERTDMVEYFGEQLDGYLVTRFGWVQSYGSRCVKPPVIYKDVARDKPMTVKWIEYAQSLTEKHVKGMLTGPVTMLKWSFVRQDIPFNKTADQVALALNDEVRDLIDSGIKIIQIDEAALREALPLKNRNKKEYLDSASRVFRICSNDIDDNIQIHTHMCYSNFSDILGCISDMDADVITIETTRSEMEILSDFPRPDIVNEIGPGVYDIHSPNIPLVDGMARLIKKALETIPAERLWINPDCGLKTRKWNEVVPSLRNMITAAEQIRSELS